MKKIHKTISLLLSGVIVGMGFLSCGTQKEIQKKIAEKERIYAEQEAQLNELKNRRGELISEHQRLQEVIKQLSEQVPLVYAPPVPRNK